MKFKEDVKTWNSRISKMITSIKKGWDIPPLIIWYLNKVYSIADGVHRSEALKKIGYKKYSCFIYFKNKEDYKNYLDSKK